MNLCGKKHHSDLEITFDPLPPLFSCNSLDIYIHLYIYICVSCTYVIYNGCIVCLYIYYHRPDSRRQHSTRIRTLSHAHTYVVAWWQGWRTHTGGSGTYCIRTMYKYIYVSLSVRKSLIYARRCHMHFSFLSTLAKFHRRGFSLSPSVTEGELFFPLLISRAFTSYLLFGRERCVGHVRIYDLRTIASSSRSPAVVEAELCIILSFFP